MMQRDKEHSQGRLPVVFIVPKLEFIGEEDEIKQQLTTLCKTELPEYAQPIDFKFIEALPLTSIGKVDYRALERMAELE